MRNLLLASSFALLLSAGSVVAQDALFVTATGDVGIGTNTPGRSVEIFRPDGTTGLLVRDGDTGPNTERTMLELDNKGNSIIRMTHRGLNATWRFGNVGNDFQMTRNGSGVIEFRINTGGDAFFAGALTATAFNVSSSRKVKQDFSVVDPTEILERVSDLEIGTWTYTQHPSERHLGPIAEEFSQAFGLGSDTEHISVVDLTGVALSGLQGAAKRIDALEAENQDLRRQLTALAERVEALARDQ